MAAGRVQSVERAFTLLECLADHGGAATLSELAATTGLPMPTIHRMMRSLVSRGYVRQEPSRRYALGPRMIRLGDFATRMLGSWARPHLGGLVGRFGETANMAILEGDAAMYVAQVPSPRSMRMFTEVGRAVTLHSTGVGKAILSMLPDEQVANIIGRTGLPAVTEHTITTPEQLLSSLAEVRDVGYALDDGEQEPGVRCVAAPITDLPFHAAVSVSGPSSRVTREQARLIAPVVIEVAAELRDGFLSST